MRAPLVSIIIPTYNRCDLLLLAVESCLSQECSSYEIIIIDDGSTDETRRIIESRLMLDWSGCNINYNCQDNAGASAARNYGLRLAKGKYVQFLDSDDELFKDKLKKQLSILEDPVNSLMQMSYCFGRMGKSIDSQGERIGVKADTVEELLELLASRITHVMSTPAALWRRDFLMAGEGWRAEISFGDDLEYYCRLVARLRGFSFISEELFWVRVHESSRLSSDTMTRDTVRSAIATQKSVYHTLCGSGYHSYPAIDAFAGALRTVYANCLRYGAHVDILGLEQWIRKVGASDIAFRGLLRIIRLRRVVGTKMLLWAHRTIINLR